MKHVVLCMAILAMAFLVAAPAIAGRPGGGGECGPGEVREHGPGGPGEGFGGPGGGFRGPGGPEGRRGGPPPGGPGRFIEKMLEGDMAAKLELTPEQTKALQQGLKKMQKQEEALHDKLQAAGKEQAELLSAQGEVDEAALMKAIEKTGRIRTQMAKLRMQPILLVKKTLTEEQLQMSRKMMRERMQERRGEWRAQRGEGDGDRDRKREGKRDEVRKRKKDGTGKQKAAPEDEA